jgi:hypothetical protein
MREEMGKGVRRRFSFEWDKIKHTGLSRKAVPLFS